MSRFQKQINDIVVRFVADVTSLAQFAAVDALQQGFGGRGSAGPVATRGPGRPRNNPAVAPRARARAGGGGRRSPSDLEGMSEKIVSYVTKNPGQRIETINKAIGISTKDAALPIRKLVKDGVLKKKGNRRATAYFPGKA